MATAFKKANLVTLSVTDMCLSGAQHTCTCTCTCTHTLQHQLDFQWRQLCSRESECSILDSGNNYRNLMVGTERFQTSKVWLLLWAQKLFHLLSVHLHSQTPKISETSCPIEYAAMLTVLPTCCWKQYNTAIAYESFKCDFLNSKWWSAGSFTGLFEYSLTSTG